MHLPGPIQPIMSSDPLEAPQLEPIGDAVTPLLFDPMIILSIPASGSSGREKNRVQIAKLEKRWLSLEGIHPKKITPAFSNTECRSRPQLAFEHISSSE
ncbi:hypothetical protein PoB_000378300 [Plakobranchus ocellatus]|uniref:Uncharacterized protein n=1 Tax=Plakobranchus ocellatus TaxID=259542 RepID=A0AAV3Y4G8_9GAST|nr:hypothetical protein PoB_000378300 [Plakobranchus ocellatus]